MPQPACLIKQFFESFAIHIFGINSVKARLAVATKSVVVLCIVLGYISFLSLVILKPCILDS